nr:molybdopterin-guanine dinucleotide biosynthesis protein B [Halobacillus sp. A5]
MPPVIFQVAGYKNSGKTTWLKAMINYASQLERVVCIKHHGHKEPLAQDHGDTDSLQLYGSGAYAMSVTGAYETQIMIDRELSLPELIHWYSYLNPDLILIEGFKNENYPKVVLIKSEEDKGLLKLANIKFIIVWDPAIALNVDVPVFDINFWQDHMETIYNYIIEEERK